MDHADLTDIKEAKDLPYSWDNLQLDDQRKIMMYLHHCMDRGVEPKARIAKRLINTERAHLRQTTLKNGLRYVTIHTETGKELFNFHEYAGLIMTDLQKHPVPCGIPARTIKNAHLGNGFILTDLLTEDQTGNIISQVEKKYKISERQHTVMYTLSPHTNPELFLNAQTLIPKENDQFTVYELSFCAGGQIGKRQSQLAIQYIHSPLEFESIALNFDHQGKLIDTSAISKGETENPEFKGKNDLATAMLSDAIRKGSGDAAIYPASDIYTMVLTEWAFGANITNKRYNAKETLNALLEAAIEGKDIDLPKMMKFQ